MIEAARRAERAELRAQRELADVPRWIWDGESLPVPIEAIAEDHYGIRIEAHDSLERFATRHHRYVSGVLLRARGLMLVDALEAARAPGRRRFTIARELGHLVLHDGSGPRFGKPVPDTSTVVERRAQHHLYPAVAYPPLEMEANAFAAGMLMPASLLDASGIRCPVLLAEACGVSLAAAERRLEYLHWRDCCARGASARTADNRPSTWVAV